ncbi:MAG: hypothetical protein Q4D79_03770 [Propionibacteriaceae bacterium]|nr:hypothetical protein [Propionibacteriaceae bacterium]
MVKLLRDADPGLGLRDLPELIETTRSLGVDIILTEERPSVLAPLADAAAYRVAQQAISNAMQHAPGARIRVTVDGDELRVHNTPARRPAEWASAASAST